MTKHTLLATAALLATGSALAQQSPWYVGGSLGLTHTDNVQSAPVGLPTSSATISTLALVAGLDQPIGRQRLFGSASLRQLAYSGHSNLNHNAYDLSLGLDWSTAERVSGTVNAQASRRLELRQALDQAQQALVGVKNEQSNESLQLTARVGMVTALTLESSLSWRRQDMSLTALDAYDYTSNAASLGLRYRFSGALSAGAALRHTRYDFPRYGLGSNQIKHNDLDLSATWVATGASTLSARLSLGRESQTALGQSGRTSSSGEMQWQWKPTGKLTVSTSLQRDSGTDTDVLYFGNNGTSIVRADDSRNTTTLASNLVWAASGKVNVKLGLRLNRRDLERNAVTAQDHLASVNLGATWQPLRNTQVGCDLSHERRSGGAAGMALPYKVATLGCFVQMVLQ